MSLIKTLLLITIFNTFIISSSYAQTITSTTGKFTFLNKGDVAPFEGTLFDPVATAKILAQKEIDRKNKKKKGKDKKKKGKNSNSTSQLGGFSRVAGR